MKIKIHFVLFLIFFQLSGCSHNKLSMSSKSTREEFLIYIKEHPSQVFQANPDAKVKDCLNTYYSRKKLPNGLVYGSSVRSYSLKHKSAKLIQLDMNKLGCNLKEDVLRDPKDNKPILYHAQKIPMQAYLCPDGGVVRVKPAGNPTNPFRPAPNATKGLRYPFNSEFDGFNDEIVKVDNDGNAIPKSRAELQVQWLVDGWADDAHTDLIRE